MCSAQWQCKFLNSGVCCVSIPRCPPLLVSVLRRLPGTFWAFFLSLEKCNFAEGSTLRSSCSWLQHRKHTSASFLPAPNIATKSCRRENKLSFGICWIVCSCFCIDLALSFHHLKNFAKQSKTHAKGGALTESSTEFVFWAARSTNFNPCLFSLSSHSLRNQSSYYICPHFHTPDPIPGTRMSWGTTDRRRRFPNRAAGSTNRKNSQCGGQSRRHCVLHGPASLTSTTFGMVTTLCHRYFLFASTALPFGHVLKACFRFPAPRVLSFTPLWGFADHASAAW